MGQDAGGEREKLCESSAKLFILGLKLWRLKRLQFSLPFLPDTIPHPRAAAMWQGLRLLTRDVG